MPAGSGGDRAIPVDSGSLQPDQSHGGCDCQQGFPFQDYGQIIDHAAQKE
jgi:hypothetical protein